MINSLIKKLTKIKDFRQSSGKRYKLLTVIIIIILGNMLGFISYRALGDFAKYYKKQICYLLKISSDKLPSYSTIRRVALGIDNSQLMEIFNQWGEELMKRDDIGKCWAIDGKSLRNTLTEIFGKEQNFVSFSSLFDVDNGLVLKMRNYENKKSSEIKETQELIKNVRKENITFTLDALHCQKETTKIIREGNNNYLIALKKNQRKLYNYLEKISEEKIANTINIEEDNSHGRRIKRQVSVWNNWQEIPEEISKKFKGIKTLIKVERSGTRKGKKYEQTVYYISSLLEKAEEISKKVRNHWGIENKLHWVKDVVMEEDKSQIKEKKAAQNMSVFKTIGINFFRLLKFDSITEGRRWLGANLSGFFALVE